MKNTLKLGFLLIAVALLLVGCGTKDITAPATAKDGETSVPKTSVTHDIHAGNANEIAGTVTVYDDANNFYFSFNTVDGWQVKKAHYHIGSSFADFPMNGGIPVPGQFDIHVPQVGDFDPYVTTWSTTVPKSNYNFTTGDTVIIAMHFELYKYLGNDEWQTETGFGGDHYEANPRWWWYFHFVLNGGGDDEYMEETAMIRMYDVPDDFTYRWMKSMGKPHPWFSYVKTYPVLTPQTYYFYAGQSYKCGEIDIWKEGDQLKIDIDMMNGWLMERYHINVQLVGYVGPPAFGNFPFCDEYDPLSEGDVISIPWNSAWDGMELNISVHADVVHPIVDK